MSNLSNTPAGGDLPDRYRNVGEQIQAFFDYAEKNPDRAVPFFVNIWETQASLTTRALALQGLGVAAKHYRVKEAFADWDVLKDIAKEVKGKGEVSNDLTRWAAATALEAIGYSQQSLQHLEGGGFTEPLDRIRREIRDRKLIEINRIPRLNSRGETTAEYERHLEFWIYGPADELLNDNDRSLNYQNLVGDVISRLHGRGVYLGLMSPNSIVQGAALRQTELIFKESAKIEEYLYGLLEEFLHNSSHETSLRIHAAEIIHTASDLNRRLKTLSKLLLEEKNPKLQEVVLRQAQSLFKRSAEIEEFIYRLLEEFLHNYSNEASVRITAAEIIYTARDLSRKLKTLSQLLLENTELRNAAVRLLNPYKQELARVEPDADTVLDALIFEYRFNKHDPKDLIISQLETYFSSASQARREISELFTGAIAASESLARRYRKTSSVLKHFLQNKQDEYLSPIESWLQILKNQIFETEASNRKLQSNKALINESIDRMGNLRSRSWGNEYISLLPLPEKMCVLDSNFVLSTTESHTYNQSYKILKDLRSIKFYLIQLLHKQDKIFNDNKSNKFDWSGLNIPMTIFTMLIFPPFLLILLIFLIWFLIILMFQVLDFIFRDPSKKIIARISLITLNVSILFFVMYSYGIEMLITTAIVIISIQFIIGYIIWNAEDKKQITEIQSIIHKLNTQWQE